MTAKLIEFIGMPRAGKSTQIRLLKNALTKSGKRVKVITDRFRASKIKTSPTEPIAYKIVFFANALEEYFKHKDKCDFVIIDRGFNDAMVWFDVENELGHIPPKRATELKNTFLEFAGIVDKTICLMVDVVEASNRHSKTNHMKVDDVGMSVDYLKALQNAYQANLNNFKNCLSITSTDSTQNIHQKIWSFVMS